MIEEMVTNFMLDVGERCKDEDLLFMLGRRMPGNTAPSYSCSSGLSPLKDRRYIGIFLLLSGGILHTRCNDHRGRHIYCFSLHHYTA